MKCSKALICSFFVFACSACVGGEPNAANDPTAEAGALTGPYLGQQPPALEPEIFAPGVVSTGLQEFSINFSPVGDEVYFFTTGPTYAPRIILQSHLVNGFWSVPREAVFSDPGRTDLYPFVAPDGNRLFFCSFRASGEAVVRGSRMEIWVVERTDGGWSRPQKIDFGGDFGAFGTYPTVAANGNLYFNRIFDLPSSAIYVSRFEGGRYLAPENLGPTVTDEAGDHHPFIAPDERYLLFASQREQDSFGDSDLFISVRREDGTWSEARNLGPNVNTSYAERSPFVTADGKYLFFSSSRPMTNLLPTGPLSYEEISRQLQSPGNGHHDIYWVSTEAIQLPR
jgi:hypothetical protein